MTSFNRNLSDAWIYTDGGGVYVAADRTVWLYWVGPSGPQPALATEARPNSAEAWSTALGELAKPIRSGEWAFIGRRDLHLIRVAWDEPPALGVGELSEWQRATLPATVQAGFCAIGVQLVSDPTDTRHSLKHLFGGASADVSNVVDGYAGDITRVQDLLAALGFGPPNDQQRQHLERWFYSLDEDLEEVTAPFVAARLTPFGAGSPWLSSLYETGPAPKVLSWRGKLASDLDGSDPRIEESSILGAWDSSEATDESIAALGAGIPVTIHPVKQILAVLAETLPCSTRRSDETRTVLLPTSEPADCGFPAMVQFQPGPFVIGVTLPDLSLVQADPANEPVIVVGDHGSGRSQMVGMLAEQAAVAGNRVVVYADDLDAANGFGDRIGAPVLSVRDLVAPGALDPFLHLPRSDAAAVAVTLLTDLDLGLDPAVIPAVAESAAEDALDSSAQLLDVLCAHAPNPSTASNLRARTGEDPLLVAVFGNHDGTSVLPDTGSVVVCCDLTEDAASPSGEVVDLTGRVELLPEDLSRVLAHITGLWSARGEAFVISDGAPTPAAVSSTAAEDLGDVSGASVLLLRVTDPHAADAALAAVGLEDRSKWLVSFLASAGVNEHDGGVLTTGLFVDGTGNASRVIAGSVALPDDEPDETIDSLAEELFAAAELAEQAGLMTAASWILDRIDTPAH